MDEREGTEGNMTMAHLSEQRAETQRVSQSASSSRSVDFSALLSPLRQGKDDQVRSARRVQIADRAVKVCKQVEDLLHSDTSDLASSRSTEDGLRAQLDEFKNQMYAEVHASKMHEEKVMLLSRDLELERERVRTVSTSLEEYKRRDWEKTVALTQSREDCLTLQEQTIHLQQQMSGLETALEEHVMRDRERNTALMSANEEVMKLQLLAKTLQDQAIEMYRMVEESEEAANMAHGTLEQGLVTLHTLLHRSLQGACTLADGQRPLKTSQDDLALETRQLRDQLALSHKERDQLAFSHSESAKTQQALSAEVKTLRELLSTTGKELEGKRVEVQLLRESLTAVQTEISVAQSAILVEANMLREQLTTAGKELEVKREEVQRLRENLASVKAEKSGAQSAILAEVQMLKEQLAKAGKAEKAEQDSSAVLVAEVMKLREHLEAAVKLQEGMQEATVDSSQINLSMQSASSKAQSEISWEVQMLTNQLASAAKRQDEMALEVSSLKQQLAGKSVEKIERGGGFAGEGVVVETRRVDVNTEGAPAYDVLVLEVQKLAEQLQFMRQEQERRLEKGLNSSDSSERAVDHDAITAQLHTLSMQLAAVEGERERTTTVREGLGAFREYELDRTIRDLRVQQDIREREVLKLRANEQRLEQMLVSLESLWQERENELAQQRQVLMKDIEARKQQDVAIFDLLQKAMSEAVAVQASPKPKNVDFSTRKVSSDAVEQWDGRQSIGGDALMSIGRYLSDGALDWEVGQRDDLMLTITTFKRVVEECLSESQSECSRMRDMVGDLQARLERTDKEFQEECNRLREKLSDSQTHLERAETDANELREREKGMKERIAVLGKSLEAERAEAEGSQNKTTSMLKNSNQSFKEQLEHCTLVHKQEVERLKTVHQQEVSSHKQDMEKVARLHKQELEKVEALHRQEILLLQQEIDKAGALHRKQLDQLASSHRSEMDQAAALHRHEMEKLTTEMTLCKSMYEDLLDEKDRDHQEMVEEIKILTEKVEKFQKMRVQRIEEFEHNNLVLVERLKQADLEVETLTRTLEDNQAELTILHKRIAMLNTSQHGGAHSEAMRMSHDVYGSELEAEKAKLQHRDRTVAELNRQIMALEGRAMQLQRDRDGLQSKVESLEERLRAETLEHEKTRRESHSLSANLYDLIGKNKGLLLDIERLAAARQMLQGENQKLSESYSSLLRNYQKLVSEMEGAIDFREVTRQGMASSDESSHWEIRDGGSANSALLRILRSVKHISDLTHDDDASSESSTAQDITQSPQQRGSRGVTPAVTSA